MHDSGRQCPLVLSPDTPYSEEIPKFLGPFHAHLPNEERAHRASALFFSEFAIRDYINVDGRTMYGRLLCLVYLDSAGAPLCFRLYAYARPEQKNEIVVLH